MSFNFSSLSPRARRRVARRLTGFVIVLTLLAYGAYSHSLLQDESVSSFFFSNGGASSTEREEVEIEEALRRAVERQRSLIEY